MVASTLVVTALVHGLSAAAFLYVGRALAARAVPFEDRLARRAFALWWTGMGAYLLIQAILHAVASAGFAPLWLFLAARVLTPGLLVAAVWGLTYHIVFLHTGRSSLARPLMVFFGIAGVAFYVAGFLPVPRAVEVGPWLAELEGTGEGPLFRAVYVVIGLAPILASLAYLMLIPRVKDRAQRYRIILVAGSILLWVGSGLVARLTAGDLAKFVTVPVFGLGAAGCVVLAYRPPAAWGRWLTATPAEAADPRDAFARRIRELV